MLSQVESKDLVGKAYEDGVDYYITKPLNRNEIVSVLRNVSEHLRLESFAQNAPAAGALTPLSNRGVRNSSRPLKSKEKLSTYATSDLEKVTGVKTPKKRAVKGAKNGEI